MHTSSALHCLIHTYLGSLLITTIANFCLRYVSNSSKKYLRNAWSYLTEIYLKVILVWKGSSSLCVSLYASILDAMYKQSKQRTKERSHQNKKLIFYLSFAQIAALGSHENFIHVIGRSVQWRDRVAKEARRAGRIKIS